MKMSIITIITITMMTMMSMSAAAITTTMMTMTTSMNTVCSCGHHHHHHHGHDADEVFTSWGRETAHKYSREELEEILKKLSALEDNEFGIILRAKGIIPDKDNNWLEFDLVPGEYEIREGSADYTGKLCVIGSQLKEDKVAELFGL